MRFVACLLLFALAVATAACNGDAKEDSEGEGETATASASGSVPTIDPSASQGPDPVSSASPIPATSVPAQWQTYSDPSGLYSLQFPADWYVSSGQAQFSSYDFTRLSTPGRPEEAMVVEVFAQEAVGLAGCGSAISVDPATGVATPAAGAIPRELGGEPAWGLVRVAPDPAIEGGLTRIESVSVVREGQCFNVVAYFTQQVPASDLFAQIVSTFEFGD
jgi:hypothetical protein